MKIMKLLMNIDQSMFYPFVMTMGRGGVCGGQSRPLPVRCGLGTNEAEAGGHVTLKANDGEEWSLMYKA